MVVGSVKTPPEMITPEEMAPRCGISPMNIRAAMRHGIFPVGFAMRMDSGQWRYYTPRAEVEDCLAGRRPSNVRLVDALIERLAELINHGDWR